MLLKEAKEILKNNGYKIIKESNHDEAFYADVEYVIKEFNETGKIPLDPYEIDEIADDYIDAFIKVSNNTEKDYIMVRFYTEWIKGKEHIYKWEEL